MCDERERLIGYVYDECDDGERRAIEEHLKSCDDCRHEIGGLRRVRQDLLAWDVPEHESVWRPFAPAPARPSWRDVPAWAMAIAAGAVLLVGAAGGVVTEAALMHSRMQALQAAAAAPAVTPADLSALESRVLATMHSEIDARVQAVAARENARPAASLTASAETEDLRNQVKRLSDSQVDFYTAVNNDLARVSGKVGSMERSLQQVAWQGPISAAR